MRLKTFAVGSALVLAIFLFAQRRTPASEPHLMFKAAIDLSHPIGQDTPGFEPQEKMKVHPVASYDTHGYFARNITVPEHFSTHVDAPAHFLKGRWTVDQLPSDRLVRPLVILDVSKEVKTDPDYRVRVEDIARWEEAYGHMPDGAVVVARTGWSDRWHSPELYRNVGRDGIAHFPGFSLDAVRFLVEGRDAVGIGIDTLSVDHGPTNDYAVHHYCAEHSVYQIENLTHLAEVPPQGTLVVVAPIKIEGGSGAPARVMALIR